MIAIYSSVLYGADFIEESIRSVLPIVDHVYVVLMQRPWGNTDGVIYKGEWIPWPNRFDNTHERVMNMKECRVSVHDAQKRTPWNRWGFALDRVLAAHHLVRREPLDEVVFIDPDCVFGDGEAERARREWDAHPEYTWAAPQHHEHWRSPAWRIERQPRSMVRFIRGDLNLHKFPDPPGSRPMHRLPVEHALQARVHNFGFSVSPQAMRWKHLTAIAFSPIVGESPPSESWLDEKWLAWHPVTNNRDLEPAAGCAGAIPRAVPYDVTLLPAAVKKRLDAGEWPTW